MATVLLCTPNTAFAGDGDEIPGEERDHAFAPNADLGLANLERAGYLDVELRALIRLGPVRMNFWFPFFLSDFSFRTEDYNEARDFLRIPRCVRVDVGDYNTPQDAYDETCTAYGLYLGGAQNLPGGRPYLATNSRDRLNGRSCAITELVESRHHTKTRHTSVTPNLRPWFWQLLIQHLGAYKSWMPGQKLRAAEPGVDCRVV